MYFSRCRRKFLCVSAPTNDTGIILLTLIPALLQQLSSDAVFFAMTWLDLPRKPKLEEELQLRKYLLLY